MKGRGVLILGMHRSGTSALTGTLSFLGVSLSKDLMPADEHNETGYWESIYINQQLELLLSMAGSRWHDWRPLDLTVLPPDALATISNKMLQSIKIDSIGAKIFAIKDPRICRAVPFFLDIFEACELEPAVVIIARHPFAVAHSLAKRDGMPFDKALLLWARHMLDAEKNTRGIKRVFVNYHDLLDNWSYLVERIGQCLEIDWPISPSDASAVVESFLKPSLRHWVADSKLFSEISGVPWFSEAWELLCQNCIDQQRRDEQFDRISSELEAGVRPFENYFGKIEARLEDLEAMARLSARELDRAKWLLGNASIVDMKEAPSAPTIANFSARIADLESRLEKLEARVHTREFVAPASAAWR